MAKKEATGAIECATEGGGSATDLGKLSEMTIRKELAAELPF